MSHSMFRHVANHAELCTFVLWPDMDPFVASQITVPIFAIVHLPSIITLSTAWFTPGGWMYIIM